MSKAYNLGDRVTVGAVVKRCNPEKRLVVLQFPDGSETPPMTFELLESLEAEAASKVYVPRDTVPQDAPPADGD